MLLSATCDPHTCTSRQLAASPRPRGARPSRSPSLPPHLLLLPEPARATQQRLPQQSYILISYFTVRWQACRAGWGLVAACLLSQHPAPHSPRSASRPPVFLRGLHASPTSTRGPPWARPGPALDLRPTMGLACWARTRTTSSSTRGPKYRCSQRLRAGRVRPFRAQLGRIYIRLTMKHVSAQ